MEGISVISNPTVDVRLTSTLSEFESNKRFNRGITIAEFKVNILIMVKLTNYSEKWFSRHCLLDQMILLQMNGWSNCWHSYGCFVGTCWCVLSMHYFNFPKIFNFCPSWHEVKRIRWTQQIHAAKDLSRKPSLSLDELWCCYYDCNLFADIGSVRHR